MTKGGPMWDPGKYLDFAAERARPFYELLDRVQCERPRRVVDVGCGAGNLTRSLAQRWPDADVDAFDSSPEMVAAAREAGVDARIEDVVDWLPEPDTDVVVSNAVLQWVPTHRDLLARWVKALPPQAWIAVQMPGNFTAPSHEIARTLVAEADWAALPGDSLLRDGDTVDEPHHYADLFADLGCVVDAWETTYVQRLTGADAVLEWMTGTALRPVKTALVEQDWQRFRAELARRLALAYPRRADGTTWFPFRRVFVVARTP